MQLTPQRTFGGEGPLQPSKVTMRCALIFASSTREVLLTYVCNGTNTRTSADHVELLLLDDELHQRNWPDRMVLHSDRRDGRGWVLHARLRLSEGLLEPVRDPPGECITRCITRPTRQRGTDFARRIFAPCMVRRPARPASEEFGHPIKGSEQFL